MDYVTLNNQLQMPQLGFGVFQVSDDEAERAVTHALNSGYRSIDTAMIYKNEEGVGRAIKASGIPREELFITTKVWNSDHGYENTLQAFDASLERLGLDYVDLYLIHWPTPANDDYVETYQALEKLYEDGKVKAIGVSNFEVEHLERILNECTVKPVLNQVECHPYLAQNELKDYCKKKNIYVEAWSPIMQGGEVLGDEHIQSIAEKHGKNPAQIVLRWHLQNDTIIIPKSVTPERIESNIDVFDFALEDEDMATINRLDKGARKGPRPVEIN